MDLKLIESIFRSLISQIISCNINFTDIEINAKGHCQHEIVETLDISVRTLTGAKYNMKDFDDIEPSKWIRGPKSKIDISIKKVNNLCIHMHVFWIF